MKVQGVVLAGGKSSRFGQDKALEVVDGVMMLKRTVHLLDELDLKPVVVTRSSRDYSLLNCPVCCDLIPDKGPLGGLLSASRIFKECSLLVLTCDMPGLQLSSLKTLLEHHDRRYKVTLYGMPGDQIHPFPGIYDSSLSELFLENVLKGKLSIREFIKSLTEIQMIQPEYDPEIFFNINRKRDLDFWKKSRGMGAIKG